MIFLDASVLLAAEDADDHHHGAARALLESGCLLATLDLAAYEVTNVAVARWRDTKAAERLWKRVLSIERLGLLVRLDSALIEAAAILASYEGISAYDASYVAAARSVGAGLASCDDRDLVSRGLAGSPGVVSA